jgi:hypothetical protein
MWIRVGLNLGQHNRYRPIVGGTSILESPFYRQKHKNYQTKSAAGTLFNAKNTKLPNSFRMLIVTSPS